MRATWSAPIIPTPRTAIRRSDMSFDSSFRLAEADGWHAARPEVLLGALGDGQRSVDGAGIHVLLDDREDVDAEPLDGFEQRWHVRDAERRLGHRAELDGLAERQVLGF